MPGKEVSNWADKAMFEAEPIDAAKGPQVYLLWCTPDPLGAIAAACKMYKGEVVRDLAKVTDQERIEYLAQVQKTKLQAPFEFVKFHFMIEGVTRAFTHQMVRQRTAVYAQESLRFAVKEDMPVALPPSLQQLPRNDPLVKIWNDGIRSMQASYDVLIQGGVPAEDARGLLPHNILTRLHYSTDLRGLLDHAGNRLCTQAQFEWRLVFAKIREAIRDARGVFMAAELSDLFKPVCYHTGKCEFMADFDRACSIRDRVEANHKIGRTSEHWGEPTEERKNAAHKYDKNGNDIIDAIDPKEWLLDPAAAR